MSDDYAAITTSIMAAVLVIATVQAERFLKTWTEPMFEIKKNLRAAQDKAVLRVRAGEEPTPEELAVLSETTAQHDREARAFVRTALPRYVVGGGAWLALTCMIIFYIAQIVRWSGTSHHGPAPELAEQVFLATMISVGALFLSLVVSTLTRVMQDALVSDRRLKGEHGRLLEQAEARLRAYEESLEPRATDDGASTSAPAGG
ncbi:hypothetical protein [Streptomyces griseoaurantiacus]|uniref:hypothetical protein n=1 Tax=Streptomyces griseoaurantiacus TaxID=68213 RepID=UPI0036ADE50C